MIEGKKGISGFTLIKPKDKITMLDIYKAVMETERLHLFDIHQNPNDECVVGRNIKPVLSGMFIDMEKQIEAKLEGMTLADCIKIMRKRIKENA